MADVLPQPGDVRTAADAMNARAEALGIERDDVGVVGDLQLLSDGNETAVTGAAVDPLRRIYGDLFDVAEAMEIGAPVVHELIADLVAGEIDLQSGLGSMFFQGLALGVMMERQRWQRGES